MSERGFSLLEMMVVVAFVAITSGLAATRLTSFQISFQRNEARQQFEADLRRVKNEAVSAGSRAFVSIAADGSSYTAYVDNYPFAYPLANERQLFKRKLPSMVTISTSQVLVFDPRGYLITEAGSYTTASITLRAKGQAYFQKTIYTTGAIN